MTTAIRDDDFDIFFDLLEEETGEDHGSKFRIYSATGQRLGQAFCNSLPLPYRRRLILSKYNPWETNTWGPIFEAIDFLTKSGE